MYIAPLRTVIFRPRIANVAVVARNDKETALELESHADTFILGRGAFIIDNINEPVNVQGYEPALESKTYRTINGEIGYLKLISGENFHLVIHQAIHILTLEHHLLCPMQCRVAGVTIIDCPKILTPLPQEESHCIIESDEFK